MTSTVEGKGQCQRADCDRPARYWKHPLCYKHYRRMVRGDDTPMPAADLREQLWPLSLTSPSALPVPHRVAPGSRGCWRVEIQAPDWEQAACTTSREVFDYFFSDSEVGHRHARMVSQAVQVCASCPILTGCQEWSIAHEEHGFWGGMSASRRKRVRTLRGQVLDPIGFDQVMGRLGEGSE